MRTNILRSVAMALGICTCGAAQAQYGGYAPSSAYGNANPPAHAPSAAPLHPTLRSHARSQLQPRDAYRLAPPQSSPYRTISTDQVGSALPPPSGSEPQAGTPIPAPPAAQGHPSASAPTHLHPAAGHPAAGHPADGSCGPCNVGQVYNQAAAAPWVGSVPGFAHGSAPLADAAAPIKNWFAGGSLLFFDFQDDGNQPLVTEPGMPPVTLLETDDVSPGGQTGFEVFAGRYFSSGKYALSGSYFLFNPGMEEQIINPAMPVDSLHGAFDNAAAYRVRRDVDIQGLELNFISFGIGGAQRSGLAGDCGSCGVAGCGGMCRPLTPSCDNRYQLQVSHGLRWLQFKDGLELAASMAANGYDAGDDDFFYDVETQNDLLGYQFGARADYCVATRLNLYAGGKFGIYGNQVDTRYGWTDSGMPGNDIDVSADDTVLSTLGELDLGVGVRLTDCWSLTGGYRLIGATNVATSVGGTSVDPADLADGVVVSANDSLLIHGGYLGAQYNW